MSRPGSRCSTSSRSATRGGSPARPGGSARKMPVLTVIGGRSAAGQRAAASHTAAVGHAAGHAGSAVRAGRHHRDTRAWANWSRRWRCWPASRCQPAAGWPSSRTRAAPACWPPMRAGTPASAVAVLDTATQRKLSPAAAAGRGGGRAGRHHRHGRRQRVPGVPGARRGRRRASMPCWRSRCRPRWPICSAAIVTAQVTKPMAAVLLDRPSR